MSYLQRAGRNPGTVVRQTNDADSLWFIPDDECQCAMILSSLYTVQIGLPLRANLVKSLFMK